MISETTVDETERAGMVPEPEAQSKTQQTLKNDSSPSPSISRGSSQTTNTESPLEQLRDETRADDVGDLEELAIVSTGPAYSTFSKREKQWIVLMVTLAAFISPTSASIYFPALNPLAEDLNVSNTLINLTITSYMIFQGLAPTIFGDLADMAGRRPAYILAFIIYLGANVGLALQNNYVALFILRCVQSTGSSGAIALSMGVVADISSSAERGLYMGIVGSGTMLGPSLGPVIGGILTQFLGWRSVFWFCFIFCAVWLVPYILAVPETGRNVVGNGSVPPQGWNMTLIDYLRQKKQERSGELRRTATVDERRQAQVDLAKRRVLRFPNPLKTIKIVMEKDISVILLYNSLIYTAFYDINASLPALYKEIYDFNDLQIGFCYIPYGVGCALASVINGKLLDYNYQRVARQIGFRVDRKHGDNLRHFPIERARINVVWPMLSVGLVSIIAYGWVLEKEVHLSAPLVLLFIVGLCVNGAFNVLSTLLVDLYPQSPATATAANNLVRCFMGAGGTGIVDIMIRSMGRGWCFTFLALVCMATSPLLLVELKWGPGWREEREVRLQKRSERKEREWQIRDQEQNDGNGVLDDEEESSTEEKTGAALPDERSR